MQSEDFCSSVARYRRVAAGGDSATPRRRRRRPLHPDRLLCSEIWLIFISLDFLQLTCNEDQSLPNNKRSYLKLIYSEKATKFWEISTVGLSYVVPVKSTMEVLQNFVAFSEYLY